MSTRCGVRAAVASTVLIAVMAGGCSSAPAQSPTPNPMPASASASAATLRLGEAGITLLAPAGYVDVTERATPRLKALPLFSDGTVAIVWVGVDAADPGKLDEALIVAVLANGADPATAAAGLGAKAGAASVGQKAVGDQVWYTFPADIGVATTATRRSLGALTRYASTNVVLVEAGRGSEVASHPQLWTVAASLNRG